MYDKYDTLEKFLQNEEGQRARVLLGEKDWAAVLVNRSFRGENPGCVFLDQYGLWESDVYIADKHFKASTCRALVRRLGHDEKLAFYASLETPQFGNGRIVGLLRETLEEIAAEAP
jgi:hypothetical protein